MTKNTGELSARQIVKNNLKQLCHFKWLISQLDLESTFVAYFAIDLVDESRADIKIDAAFCVDLMEDMLDILDPNATTFRDVVREAFGFIFVADAVPQYASVLGINQELIPSDETLRALLTLWHEDQNKQFRRAWATAHPKKSKKPKQHEVVSATDDVGDHCQSVLVYGDEQGFDPEDTVE